MGEGPTDKLPIGPCDLGKGYVPPDLTNIPFIVVPPDGYVRDPDSGKFYIGPDCWAKLKGALT